jgi:carotenoid cleavage dioxygenase-like enzyme
MFLKAVAFASAWASCRAAGAPDPDLGFSLLFSGVGDGEVIREDITDKVIGNVPNWLDGVFIQNGGGRFEWPGTGRKLTSPADAYAKLEIISFLDGRVEYTSKFARTKWWNNSVKENDIAPSIAFSPPSPPRLSDKLGMPNVLAPNDNLGVNVVTVGGQILMLSDQPGCISFDSNTLEFGRAAKPFPGSGDFKDEPPLPAGMGGVFGSAHPLWTGSSLDGSGDAYGLLNVMRLTVMDPRVEEVRLFRITAEEQKQPGNPWLTRRAITVIKMPEGEYSPYMHSFVLASKGGAGPTHAVLVAHAMHVAMAKVIAGVGLKPIPEAFDIDLKRPTTFYVIRLSDGVIEQKIDVHMSSFGHAFNSTIVSHTVNGYFASDGKLIVDIIGYDFLFFNRFAEDIVLDKATRDQQAAKSRAQTFRFTLDTNQGRALDVVDFLPNSDWEFPTINEAFKGSPYCHAYGYDFNHKSVNSNGATGWASMAVVKYNMCGSLTDDEMRDHISFSRPFNYFVEPWFVPRPGGSAEDDGVVLAMALDGRAGKGVVYILDAGNMSVVATIPLTNHVNQKTHGRFIWRRALKHPVLQHEEVAVMV